MRIYEKSGVLKSGILQVRKSVSTMIFIGKQLETITNETISLFVERKDSQNEYLATDILLKDFLIANMFNNEGHYFAASQYSDFENQVIYTCEIGQDAGLKLLEGEVLNIELKNLKAPDFWAINVVEDFDSSLGYTKYEKKQLTVGESDKRFNVADYDLAILPAISVAEIGLAFIGSKEIRFDPLEIQMLSKAIKPVYALDIWNYTDLEDVIVIPLVGVDELTVYKAPEYALNFTVMKYDQLGGVSNARTFTPVGTSIASGLNFTGTANAGRFFS